MIGGGIRASHSTIDIVGNTSLVGNSATYGGAVNTFHGKISIQGPTPFINNTANKEGGALYAAGTKTKILNKVVFTYNLANGSGGALYFENRASLNISASKNLLLVSSYNYAHQYGGLMYHEDSASVSQCSYSDSGKKYEFGKLPECFHITHTDNNKYPSIVSNNNSAGSKGSFLFGGLLNKCQITSDTHSGSSYVNSMQDFYINYEWFITGTEISSKPYSLCLCSDIDIFMTCSTSRTLHKQVYRGQKFTVSLLAEGQVDITATTVTAITSSTAKLETYQTSQPLPGYCRHLPYTLCIPLRVMNRWCCILMDLVEILAQPEWSLMSPFYLVLMGSLNLVRSALVRTDYMTILSTVP